MERALEHARPLLSPTRLLSRIPSKPYGIDDSVRKQRMGGALGPALSHQVGALQEITAELLEACPYIFILNNAFVFSEKHPFRSSSGTSSRDYPVPPVDAYSFDSLKAALLISSSFSYRGLVHHHHLLPLLFRTLVCPPLIVQEVM